jgi:hypothetical protein
MSCGCNDNGYTVSPKESVASQLENLITALLGTITKTITDGRAIWTTPCSPNDSITQFPRNAGEGVICYLLRVFTYYFTPFKGTHNSANPYYFNNLVTTGGAVYLALLDVPAGTLISNTTYWSQVLAPTAGPAGATGPAGSGSAINYAVTTKTGNYTVTNTDAVILCDPAATQTITLTAASAVNGKWFKVNNRTGAFTVNIVRAGSDTIEGSAGGETTLSLTYRCEGVTLVSDGVSKWSVF